MAHDQRDGRISKIIKNLFFNSPPLGLAYIAAVLEQHEIPVRIMDAGVEGWSFEETVNRLAAARPDIVGITSSTIQSINLVRLAQMVRFRLPGATIVLGGSYVSSLPDEAMANDCYDIACIGEGEYTMLELVEALRSGGDLSSVKGIYFRKDGKVVRTEPRPPIQNLDELPLPARHLLPLGKYVPQPNDGPYLPKFSMITSRGCPYRCIFCDHSTFGISYRSHSAKRIVDEMEELVRRYGVQDIAFVDSLFMVSRKRVLDIADEIIARGLKVHWTCTTRANIADEPTLRRMKESGCWRTRIGIEAGNADVLSFIRKGVTREQIQEVTQTAERLGLHPKGFFMIAHPTDTEATIRETIEFAKSLPLTDITVQFNTPMPGTEQWEFFRKYGTLTTEDWSSFTYWEPVFVPNGLTVDKILELYRDFYREFYLRPIIIWRHLKMLKGIDDVKRFVRGLQVLLGIFGPMTRRKREPRKAT
jgi:radical SAM superfamily enzyme YgiQ (UPF0313 family)